MGMTITPFRVVWLTAADCAAPRQFRKRIAIYRITRISAKVNSWINQSAEGPLLRDKKRKRSSRG